MPHVYMHVCIYACYSASRQMYVHINKLQDNIGNAKDVCKLCEIDINPNQSQAEY